MRCAPRGVWSGSAVAMSRRCGYYDGSAPILRRSPTSVGACRAFVMLCREAGLFTARLIALDGSKFRAVASGKKVVGHTKIAEEAAYLDRKIAAYLNRLDKADTAEPDDRLDAAPAAMAALQARRGELDRLAAKLDAEGRATIVEGEEDARSMGKGNGPKPPS